jgi:transposase
LGVAIGVDSHKKTLSAAAVDDLGRFLGTTEVPNDPRGHEQLLRWVHGFAEAAVIGVEGSGNYGRALARFLLQHDETVREVPSLLAHREAKRTPARGKSDPTDAEAIARVTSRGVGLVDVRAADLYEDLRLLVTRHDQLKTLASQLANRIHQDLVIAVPGYHSKVPKLASKAALERARSLLRGDHSVRADLVRERIGELRRVMDVQRATLGRIRSLVAESETSLTGLVGIGELTAAKILGELGGPARLRSKSGWAMLTGVAPLLASSGSTNRHRLNRGGNRQLNFAMHTIALTRLRCDVDSLAYFKRKRAEGKSKTEAMRCLKRRVADLVYRQVTLDLKRLQEAA